MTSSLSMQVDSIYSVAMIQPQSMYWIIALFKKFQVLHEVISGNCFAKQFWWKRLSQSFWKYEFDQKENEVQKWVDKGQICPSGWQGPRTFFGMTEIRDATASKKTKLLTLRGRKTKFLIENFERPSSKCVM